MSISWQKLRKGPILNKIFNITISNFKFKETFFKTEYQKITFN